MRKSLVLSVLGNCICWRIEHGEKDMVGINAWISSVGQQRIFEGLILASRKEGIYTLVDGIILDHITIQQ